MTRDGSKVDNVGLVMNLVIKYFDKYNSIPNAKVVQLLAKTYSEKHADENIDMSKVNELLSDVSSMSLNIPEDVLTRNLHEFIRRNAFYNALFDNAEILDRNPDNYQKVVDKCLENFDKVQKIVFNDTDLGLNYFDEEAMRKHWEFLRNPEAKLSTGWVALDNYTNGGFLRDGKMLGLVMAQAGLGKSVVLSNLAVNFLKQNLSVVVISLEMSQDVYAQRFDAHITNSNINKLKENEETAIDRIKAFYKNHPKANLYIKEYPPRSVSTSQIETYLENLRTNGHNFDAIIIDYLNLVLPNHKSDSMYKDGLSTSEDLRALSYKFNCPVISATQCNSEGMNSEEIDMQNISESRGIAHTCDFLVALYRRKNEDNTSNMLNMRIIKNRLGGRVGTICEFTMDPDTLVLSDVTFDEQFDGDSGSEIGKLVKSLPDQITDDDIDNID